jgi:hypothetical protein
MQENGKVITSQLEEKIPEAVEETLNGFLDSEADNLLQSKPL